MNNLPLETIQDKKVSLKEIDEILNKEANWKLPLSDFEKGINQGVYQCLKALRKIQ